MHLTNRARKKGEARGLQPKKIYRRKPKIIPEPPDVLTVESSARGRVTMPDPYLWRLQRVDFLYQNHGRKRIRREHYERKKREQ